ncbi:hypothetical protein KFU94_09115 [Chloroflexi bacterium TSY]|nr:hypothetical protein [Chloroflexi bacterium TSY]
MIQDNYGRPLVVFWWNLRHIGIDMYVDETGKLRVKADRPQLLSPYLKDEITKRAALLGPILDKRGLPDKLQEFILTPLIYKEAERAVDVARRLGWIARIHQVNGRWLLHSRGRKQDIVQEHIERIEKAYIGSLSR